MIKRENYQLPLNLAMVQTLNTTSYQHPQSRFDYLCLATTITVTSVSYCRICINLFLQPKRSTSLLLSIQSYQDRKFHCVVLSNYSLKESTMIEDAKEMDINSFLDMILEVISQLKGNFSI